MATVDQDFEMWQGDTVDLRITVDGLASLAGLGLKWAMSEVKGRTPVLEKADVAGGGVGITFEGNVAIVRLDGPDTRTLTPRMYHYELRVIDAEGAGNTVATGRNNLHPAILDDI